PRQMFGRQRRPKSLSLASPVLLPYQPQHPSAKSRRLGSRARTSHTAMLQPLGPFLPIPLPQPPRPAANQPPATPFPILPPFLSGHVPNRPRSTPDECAASGHRQFSKNRVAKPNLA